MKVSAIFVFTVAIAIHITTASFNPTQAQTNKAGINTVVIDAGHGGKDAGSVSGSRYEKDINLAVALRLGALINENYPKVKVIYTRKTDVFVELFERGDIANRANADLFISIHTNSAKSSAATGTETLIMGADKAGKNLEVAMKENDVIMYEEDYQTKYQGYTPGSAESFIIFSLMQYSYQSQSMILAAMVQRQFTQNSNLRDRGVKQAGVLVLWKTAMPSILTEFGFISNPTESKFIYSEQGRELHARCLFNAFSEYKTKVEGNSKPILLDNASLNEPAQAKAEESAPAPKAAPAASTASAQAATGRNSSAKVIYRIQVLSSPQKVAKNSTQFGPYRGEVTEKIINNRYKYFVGELTSAEEALSLQRKVRTSIKDAFIVPFVDDRQISMEEARKMK